MIDNNNKLLTICSCKNFMFYILYIIILHIFYILISKFIQYLCYNEYILILFLTKEKISNLIIFIIDKKHLCKYIFLLKIMEDQPKIFFYLKILKNIFYFAWIIIVIFIFLIFSFDWLLCSKFNGINRFSHYSWIIFIYVCLYDDIIYMI